MKSFRNIRVIPVALIAIASLAVLKVAGLVLDGGYVFDYDPQLTKRSWAQENLNFPGGVETDITGSTHGAPKEAKKEEAPKPAAPETKPEGVVLHPEDNPQNVSAAEKAILERLQSRRQELDARAREIDIRESLLRAAEQRIQTKTDEMKAIEQRISAVSSQKSEADSARFKSIVTMYEGMKPKDAAKVFDRLEMSVLIEIASQIQPRKMSDILGLMMPEAAERLTVELARRAGADRPAEASAELPKIEGKVLPAKTN
ncbi:MULTISPECIES: flagellar protein FlbB [unclassified Bradyrhizobium]|uniref:MotE family protein n=1 Tax=unclassified Bradyrhizobium TaxID=2631580 RepID=UPI0028E1C62E|nr:MULTISPECIES: flagellar protein FlbB [unclassified Bradyrhizobium]